MIKLVGRKQALHYAPLFDFAAMIQSHQIEGEFEFISTDQEAKKIRSIYDLSSHHKEEAANNLITKVFHHPEDNILLYPSMLSNSLTSFFEMEGVNSLFFFPHLRMSIIGEEDNNTVALRKARQLLLRVTNDRNYKEAYQADQASFDEVIQALFWITRLDATIPEFIFMYPEGADYFISFCKYGNLHFYISPESDKSALLNSLKKSGLQEWRGKEYERFSDSGAIEGRFTVPEK